MPPNEVEATSRGPRRHLRVGGLLLLAVVTSLAALELHLRGADRTGWGQRAAWADADLVPFPELGYEQPPLPRAKAARELRILVLGDSLVSSSVAPEARFSELAAAALGEKSGRPVSIVNLGRPRGSFPIYLRELAYWRRRLSPDAVVVHLSGGDDFSRLDRTLHLLPPPPHGYPSISHVPRTHSLRLLDHLVASWERRVSPGARRSPTPAHLRQLRARQSRHHLREGLGDLGAGYLALKPLLLTLEALEQDGVATMVLASPPDFIVDPRLRAEVAADTGVQPTQLEGELPALLLRRAARQAGYSGRVFDLTPCLAARMAEGEDLYDAETARWNRAGHSRVGELLTTALTELLEGAEGGSCPGPAPRPDLVTAVDRWAESVMADGRGALQLASRLGRESFSERRAVATQLEAAGLHPGDGIRARLTGGTARGPTTMTGWADLPSGAGPLLCGLLHNGRLRALGLVPVTPGQPGEVSRVPFQLRVPHRCAQLTDSGATWAFVVRGQEFAWAEHVPKFACR